MDLGESDVALCTWEGNQVGDVSSCEKCLYTPKKKEKEKKKKMCVRVCECNNVSSVWGKCIWLSQQCSWQHEEYNKAYKYPV